MSETYYAVLIFDDRTGKFDKIVGVWPDEAQAMQRKRELATEHCSPVVEPVEVYPPADSYQYHVAKIRANVPWKLDKGSPREDFKDSI